MIFFKKLIFTATKLFLLLMIVSFEKVVGLPVFFITVFIVFFSNERGLYKYAYLVFPSIFLALIYGLSFSLSIFLLICLVLIISYGNNFISNDISRVLVSIYSLIIIVAIASNIYWGPGVVIYFVISSLLMMFFLMKTLFFKHGLERRFAGKRSNFFK